MGNCTSSEQEHALNRDTQRIARAGRKGVQVGVEFPLEALSFPCHLELDASVRENQDRIFAVASKDLDRAVTSADLSISFGGQEVTQALQTYDVEAGATVRVQIDYDAIEMRRAAEEARRVAEEARRVAEEEARRAKEAAQVEYRDTDGDKVAFRLNQGGTLEKWVNGQYNKVVTTLRLRPTGELRDQDGPTRLSFARLLTPLLW